MPGERYRTLCQADGYADYSVRPVRFPGQPAAAGDQGNVTNLDRQFPGRVETIFRAVTDVVPSHLADVSLFDFGKLGSERIILRSRPKIRRL